MNKSDLIDVVAGEMKSSKADAGRAVEAVIDAIRQGLQHDHKVTISGFGTFVSRERPARTGVNPVTKERMTIGPSKTCSFRAAPALKDDL